MRTTLPSIFSSRESVPFLEAFFTSLLTLHSQFTNLQRYYGTSNFTDCVELLHTLNSTPCVPGRIQEYVSKWRTGISRLQSARFSVDIKLSISQFVRGLPLTPAYDALRADLPRRISSSQDYGSLLKTLWNSTVYFGLRTRCFVQIKHLTHRIK